MKRRHHRLRLGDLVRMSDGKTAVVYRVGFHCDGHGRYVVLITPWPAAESLIYSNQPAPRVIDHNLLSAEVAWVIAGTQALLRQDHKAHATANRHGERIARLRRRIEAATHRANVQAQNPNPDILFSFAKGTP